MTHPNLTIFNPHQRIHVYRIKILGRFQRRRKFFRRELNPLSTLDPKCMPSSVGTWMQEPVMSSLERFASELERSLHVKEQEALIAECKVAVNLASFC